MIWYWKVSLHHKTYFDEAIKAPCWEKHRDIPDKRHARKSNKHLEPSKISEYVRPILYLIKTILVDNYEDRNISSKISEYMKLLMNKVQPWLKIEALKIIYQLVSENEETNSIFRANIKDNKHYFALLKVFRDSYYDVQTISAKILRTLELEPSIRDKVFSFLNISIWPPEERDIGMNILDFNSHHTPCFKNNSRNIFDESEDLKEKQLRKTPNMNSKINIKGTGKFINSTADHIVNRRNTKFLAEMNKIMNNPDDSSNTSFQKYGDFKPKDSNLSNSSYSDSDFTSAFQINQTEEMKSQDYTHEETKMEQQDIDPVDNYLNNFIKNKITRDAPIPYDATKLEFESHRKSGKSTSPYRNESERQTITKYRTSTNIPATTSISSEDNTNQIEYDEDSIPEELCDLYQVFLTWIFSPKRENLDTSNPIKYKMMIPLWLSLSAKSTKIMKQKAITDLNFMTAVETNANKIMKEKSFQSWILDMLYSVFPPKSDSDKDPIWDMGCKLYIQISKMWFLTNFEAHKYTHYLISWPLKRIL